ncbi:hypothetical protein K9M79_00045 [Candidatus Woesearchaeota archaeon]|nr:hypothetical protein [Candidatus Woesearchaeota archaeon]
MKKKLIVILLLAATIISIFGYTVHGDGTFANIESTLLSQDPDPCEPGSFVEVRYKIENVGNSVAKDVQFVLTPEYPFSFFPGETGARKLGDLYMRQIGNDAYVLYYRLKVDSDATDGSFPIRMKYSVNGGNYINLEEDMLRVRPTNAILYIEKVEQEPEIFTPGDKSKLSLRLKNTAGTSLKNIKVVISNVQATGAATPSPLPMSPVGSSNEMIIPKLGSNQVTNVVYEMIVDPDAESKIYKVPITLSYSDNFGHNYTKEEVISIAVHDNPQIFVKLDDTDIKMSGQTGSVSIKVVNRGLEDIKFVSVKLDDSDAFKKIGTDEIYLGNIDSDDYETADFNIQVQDTGKVSLPIVITYMDSLNTEYMDTISLDLNTYSQEELEQLGISQQGNSNGMIIVVVIIVLGLVVWWFMKRKKNNKDKEIE